MKLAIILLSTLIISAGCTDKKSSDKPASVDETVSIDKIDTSKYRRAAKGFMQELKGVLVSELQNEGVVSAIKVCSDTAQALTKNYAEENNLNIRRVSLKTRNKANNPDSYEQKVLKQFHELNSQDKLSKGTEVIELVGTNGTKQIRYMKPILTNGVCLNCHGSDEQISPKVKKVIAANYENDKARNYKVGDVRGAISIVDRLN